MILQVFRIRMHGPEFINPDKFAAFTYSFHFKNTGETDLIISSANGSCGCTVGTFPHEPIKAGQESKIDVVFDSGGKSGLVEKTVTLTTNCIPNTKVLTINSNIIVPPEK